jgi:hypothetical protein
MTREEKQAINEAAILRLKPTIDANYPPKQFVAIAGGKIVADDADIYQLREKLIAMGIDPMDSIVDRAGVDTLSELFIL